MAGKLSRALVTLVCLTLGCTTAPPRSAPAAPAAGAASSSPATPAPAPRSDAPPASSPAAATSERVAAVPLDPPLPVRVISVGLAAQASTYMALEHGYFRELGLDVELVSMAGTSDTIALLGSDQLEVGIEAISPGFFNAVARDIGIRMVADHGSNYPGRATGNISVRADLLDLKPWTGFQDLRGLKIAVQQANSIGEYILERALALGGLQRDEVEVIAPMTYPDMAVAFGNRAIEAAVNQEPWAVQQERQGIIKKVAHYPDIEPYGHIAGLLYSQRFASNTPAARNFLVAYLRGVRDWWDAYDGRTDYGRVVAVLQKYSPLKDEALLRQIPQTGQNPAGYMDPAKLAAYQDWFAERGLIPRKVEIARAYDPSFADYANTVLGPYQPVDSPRRPN